MGSVVFVPLCNVCTQIYTQISKVDMAWISIHLMGG